MDYMLQKDCWPCPFCEKGIIEVLIRPLTFSLKRVKSGKGKSTIPRRIKEEIIILTTQCPNCGKSKEEIRRMWREQQII
jgi:hypothetical protein